MKKKLNKTSLKKKKTITVGSYWWSVYNSAYQSMEAENVSAHSGRLDPVRFLINERLTNKYANIYNTRNELIRIFGNKLNIDNIKFIKSYGKKISIVTDDQVTHTLLNNQSNWTHDSFEKGIKILDKNVNQTFKLSLRVNSTIPIEGEFTQDLNKIGIINPQRVFNRHTSEATSIVYAELDDLSKKEEYLKNGIKICFSKIEVKPRYTLKQCYNCFKTGHLKAECSQNFQSCLKCGGKHHSDDCDNEKIICSNCGLNHVAVSRKCEHLKIETSETSNTGRSKHTPGYRNYSTALKTNTNSLDEEKIKKLIEDNIKKIIMTSDIIQHIISEVMTKVEKLILKSITENFKLINLSKLNFSQPEFGTFDRSTPTSTRQGHDENDSFIEQSSDLITNSQKNKRKNDNLNQAGGIYKKNAQSSRLSLTNTTTTKYRS